MRLMLVMLGTGLLWGPVANAQGGPPESPFRYALFSLGDLTLRNGVRAIVGDVGSNDGTTTIGRGVRVSGAGVGRVVRLRKGSQADEYFCLLSEGRAGVPCQALPLPVVATTDLPPVQLIPGATQVKVPKRSSTAPVPSGAYGDVRIRERGTLTLAGGRYVFDSIRIAERGQLLCAAPCELGVSRYVRLRSRARLAGNPGVRSEAVRVNVARTGNRTVFAAGTRSTVSALVYAPGGRIELRGRGNFVGSFVGGRVRVDQGALVQAALR
jgi:hypothetical protein